MKFSSTVCLGVLLLVSPALAQWKVVAVTATGPEKHPDALPTDLWLKIELKNDSQETLYVPGMGEKWYMIESFIKEADGDVWERRNVGLDQKLVMTAVAPGATINAGGRYSRKDVGRSMLLTFAVARSKNDTKGSPILVGPFTIPAPDEPKKK